LISLAVALDTQSERGRKNCEELKSHIDEKNKNMICCMVEEHINY